LILKFNIISIVHKCKNLYVWMHNIKFQIKGELDFKIFMQFCAAIYLKFCFFFCRFRFADQTNH
jgi:hypothetical protein